MDIDEILKSVDTYIPRAKALEVADAFLRMILNDAKLDYEQNEKVWRVVSMKGLKVGLTDFNTTNKKFKVLANNLLYKTTKDVCEKFNISIQTFERSVKSYLANNVNNYVLNLETAIINLQNTYEEITPFDIFEYRFLLNLISCWDNDPEYTPYNSEAFNVISYLKVEFQRLGL